MMSLNTSDRLREALRNPPIGLKATKTSSPPEDLGALLRRCQDKLRGRPQTTWEIARERFSYAMPDWEGFAMGVILASCAAIMAAMSVILWVAILAAT